jgi:hypothetical protein
VGPEIFEFSKKHFSAAARNTLAAHCSDKSDKNGQDSRRSNLKHQEDFNLIWVQD